MKRCSKKDCPKKIYLKVLARVKVLFTENSSEIVNQEVFTRAKYAQMLADERKKEGHHKSKLDDAMMRIIHQKLALQWSPEQINGYCPNQKLSPWFLMNVFTNMYGKIGGRVLVYIQICVIVIKYTKNAMELKILGDKYLIKSLLGKDL